MSNTGSGKTITTLEKAFKIIELLREEEPMTLTELSEIIPQSKSNLHYYLRTLEQQGCVIQQSDGYILGDWFLDVSGHVFSTLPIYNRGRVRTDRLAEETEQRALLVAVRGNTSTVVYESQEGAANIRMPVGSQFPLATTSFGRAILAHQPTETIETVVERHEKTENSPEIDREQIFDDLEKVSDHGFAFDDESRQTNVSSIAAPVFEREEDPAVGAIGIMGRKNEIQNPYKGAKARRFAEDMASVINQAAKNLSEELSTKYE